MRSALMLLEVCNVIIIVIFFHSCGLLSFVGMCDELCLKLLVSWVEGGQHLYRYIRYENIHTQMGQLLKVSVELACNFMPQHLFQA